MIQDSADSEPLIEAEEYEAVMNDFKLLRKRNPDDKKVPAYIDKLVRMKEQERQVSHYGILGINEKASDAKIKAGFRQAALKWHPVNK
jgi:DnaJ-class molecular chaperone